MFLVILFIFLLLVMMQQKNGQRQKSACPFHSAEAPEIPVKAEIGNNVENHENASGVDKQ